MSLKNSFKELCEHFSHSKINHNPVMTQEIFFTAQWVSGSRNDVLVKYLKEHQIPYLYSHYHRIWFFDEEWKTVDSVCKGDSITFYFSV